MPASPLSKHHLPLTSFDLLPTFQEERDFGFSTDQRCQSSGLRHIETPSGSTFLEDAVHVDGLSDTSERLCSQVLALEIALNQAVGGITDDDRIGLPPVLECGQQHSGLHPVPTVPDALLHPCPRRRPDPYVSQVRTASLIPLACCRLGIEGSHGIDNSQASPYCSLSIIFMGLGITEVDQESIPQELRNVPVVALDNFRASTLVRTHDLA